MQLNDFSKVLQTFRSARTNLGEILSSCEFIDGHALKCVTENLNLMSPIEVQETNFYMLIETSGNKRSLRPHDRHGLGRPFLK